MTSRRTVHLLAIAVLGLLIATPSMGADLVVRKAKAARGVASETRIQRVYDCRAGWWQTVTWGKVMPRYAERCYAYRVARR